MNRAEEFAAKLERVEKFLNEQKLGGIVLSRADNFAWLGCGADSIVDGSGETGVGSLVVKRGAVTLLTNNIEAERLQAEELQGVPLAGVEVYPWHQGAERARIIERLRGGTPMAADDGSAGLAPVPAGFARLRYTLTDAEVERYRALGRESADGVEAAARAIEKGMTEADAAALLAAELRRRSIRPAVLLVAADERIESWRHPIPQREAITRCAMLVVCGRRHGLTAALTRLVHFGEMSRDLVRRHMAACTVDAQMIWATVPGARAADIFAAAQRTYAEAGFPGEWELHHQGGAIGYRSRDYIATAQSAEVVHPRQAFAWNPSVRGAKSEDTMLVTAKGPALLTEPGEGWPIVHIEGRERVLHRADMLVK